MAVFWVCQFIVPPLPISVCLKMEDLFIQHVCGSWFPGCFVRELVCLRQQAGGALGSSSPLVRLYPSRLSNTGLGSCHEAGWAWDKLLFLHQNNEETHKQTAWTIFTLWYSHKHTHRYRYIPHPPTHKVKLSWWMNLYCGVVFDSSGLVDTHGQFGLCTEQTCHVGYSL